MENQENLMQEEGVSEIPEAPEVPEKKDPVKLSKRLGTNQEEVMGWIFTGIPLLGFLIFGLIPLVLSIYISMNHFPGLKLYEQVDELFQMKIYSITFMGLKNFGMVLGDVAFWKSVLNTLFVVVTTVASLALSVFISMMLYHCKKGKKFFQPVFFIPYVCSLVAVTFMWQLIFNADHGILNAALIALGGQAKNWITYSATRFRLVMFVVMLWS
ncbi:MAG: sugar ABC transporter permease, partial [Clostridia bacterium]|nr:sugar ABC transporter permease [Clostridia bacterium]